MKNSIFTIALATGLLISASAYASSSETTVVKSNNGTTTTTTTTHFTRMTDTDPRAKTVTSKKEFTTYAYNRWDKNADGFITADEWDSNVVTWYGPSVKTYKNYAFWDTNGNGKLDAAEFDRVMNDTNLYDTWNTTTTTVATPTVNPAARFSDYDLNSDGSITRSEWEQVHKK